MRITVYIIAVVCIIYLHIKLKFIKKYVSDIIFVFLSKINILLIVN